MVIVSVAAAVVAVTRASSPSTVAIEHSLPYAAGVRSSVGSANAVAPVVGSSTSVPIAGKNGVPSKASPTQPPPSIVVDVGGAVVKPGVYKLDAGSRVTDALNAAGGVTLDSDDERLNKAEKLSDGIRIYVPRKGTNPPTVVGVSGSGSIGAGGSVASVPSILNLNSADIVQLDALPGVGPATAAAIVQYRQQHGPFASVDKLTDVPGIGPAKLERLRAFLTV